MPRAGPLSSSSLTQSTVSGGQPLCALGFQDTTLSSNFLPRRSSRKHHRYSPRLSPQATSLHLPWLPWRPCLVPWVSIPSGCTPRHTELSTLDCEPSSFIQPSTRHLGTGSQVELRPQPHLLVTCSAELMPLNACLLRLCVSVTSLFPTSARAEFLSRWGRLYLHFPRRLLPGAPAFSAHSGFSRGCGAGPGIPFTRILGTPFTPVCALLDRLRPGACNVPFS